MGTPKREIVYGSFTQEALDYEYDMRVRCPHFAETFAALEPENTRVIQDYECRLDVPFGKGDLERFDIWPAKGGAPILLFIHGGYWRAFDKAMFRHIVTPFVEAGAAVVLNNYDLCPNVTMDDITRQNQAAFEWIWHNARDIGGDPDNITVTGHSAGGHLTGMLLATDWAERGLPADPIKAAAPLSGLFDLEPLRCSYLNADLHMDKEMSDRNSPIHFPPDTKAPILVAVGGGETNEFRRQSRIYAEACQAKGLECEYLEVSDRDHVRVAGEYQFKDSPLTSRIFAMMGL